MAKNVTINGVDYQNVPSVKIPLTSDPSQEAEFFDTSDATVSSADQILDGYSAYADGVKLTGSIPTKDSTDLEASGATVTAPAGYYAESASKSVASGSATTPATSITANPSITASGSNIVAQVSAQQNVTPTVSAGYVSSGTAGQVSVSGQGSVSAASLDANLVAGNIKSGKTIFGVAGSLTLPTITQNSTTKILSIS